MKAPALVSTFEALCDRYRIRAQVVAVTALRIGAGKAQDPVATDQPIMRDAMGRPFLPGSSLKGALRSGLERILRGLSRDRRRGLWSCDLFERDGDYPRCTAVLEPRSGEERPTPSLDEIREALCTTCGLFGSMLLGGRLFIHDLPLVNGTMLRSDVRDGVGINRDLRTAQAAIKYDTETVPPGTRFELEVLLENPDDTQLALVLKGLAMVDDGSIPIGGMTSRGLGRVQLESPAIERIDAKRLLEGSGYEQLDWEQEQDRASKTLADRIAELDNADPGLEEG